jgi:hypothetical protein
MQIQRVIELYPTVFHMAEAGSWASIRERGLMSTSAVLDHFNVVGAERSRIEAGHRTTKIPVQPGRQDAIVLRDQIPMPPARLLRALGGSTTPEDWYRIINAKVFFWAEEHRLHNLLNARQYRNLEHDVLWVDTASLVAAHGPEMWLCRMNSGNTFPMPFARDASIFQRIANYPVTARGNPSPAVVEVLVDHSVPDIARHVKVVYRMRGSTVLGQIA